MYEDLTYEQLKEMPDEQKKEVLSKMLEEYKDSKTVASKIPGASFIAISNLIRKLIEGKPVGRIKKEETDTTETTETNIQAEKPKRKYTRRIVDREAINEYKQEDIQQKTEVVVHKNINTSINIPAVFGNELVKRLEGLAKSILDDKEYEINIQITEL